MIGGRNWKNGPRGSRLEELVFGWEASLRPGTGCPKALQRRPLPLSERKGVHGRSEQVQQAVGRMTGERPVAGAAGKGQEDPEIQSAVEQPRAELLVKEQGAPSAQVQPATECQISKAGSEGRCVRVLESGRPLLDRPLSDYPMTDELLAEVQGVQKLRRPAQDRPL